MLPKSYGIAAGWPLANGAGWTPFDLGAALLGYWDARAGITIATGVSSWKDRVAGYDMVQATAANQPAYNAAGLNGDATVVCDGSNDFLSMESVPFPVGAAPCEIWALADFQPSGNCSVFAYGGNSGLTRRQIGRNPAFNVYTSVGDGAVAQTFTDTSAVNNGRRVIRNRIEAAATMLTVDAQAPVWGAVVPATGSTRVRIGANTNDSAGQFMVGSIAAVLVTGLLTDAQAAQLYAMLSARRGAAG